MADGYRSLLAPWIGGAANDPAAPPSAAGYRSMLAFWAGGAANSGTAPTPTTVDYGLPRRRLDLIDQDDEEILAAVGFLLRSM